MLVSLEESGLSFEDGGLSKGGGGFELEDCPSDGLSLLLKVEGVGTPEFCEGVVDES